MKNFLTATYRFIKRNMTIIIILFIFLFLYICDNASIKAGNVIIQNLKSIATSFTPTTDLFDDGSEISFVSYFFGMQSSQKQNKETVFCLPNNMIENYDENKNFVVVSGIVESLCAGRVAEVGYNEKGEKYIKLEHTNGYFTKYVGLTNIGVSMGEYVSISSPIGISEGKAFLYIENKNDLLKMGNVTWKN